MNLNGVQIGAEDVNKLAEFYKKAFGEPKWAMEDGWYGWDIGSGHLVFGPHDKAKGPSPAPERVMVLFECKDVVADYAKLMEAGATEVAKPYKPDTENGDFWLATAADPEGNYLQLASPM